MAGLGAVNLVGESIAALLRSRRSLLANENRLGPVPPAQDIAHVSLAKLTGASPPNAGLSVSCYHIGRSSHTIAQPASQDPSAGMGISLELSYLLASWSSTPSEEQSLLSWAMLELNRFPVLDRGQLLGDAWARDEMVQIVPEEADFDLLNRIWSAFKQKYHLSSIFKARVVRIGYGPSNDALPVTASRFGFADTDPLMEANP